MSLQFSRRLVIDLAILGSALFIGHYLALNTLNADQMRELYSVAVWVGLGAVKLFAVSFIILGAAMGAGVASYLQNGRRRWPSLLVPAFGGACSFSAGIWLLSL